jgi:hypothetical protein
MERGPSGGEAPVSPVEERSYLASQPPERRIEGQWMRSGVAWPRASTLGAGSRYLKGVAFSFIIVTFGYNKQ